MSIAKNVGGLSKYLSKIRTEPIYFQVKKDIDVILNKIPAIGKSAAKALNKAKGTIKYLIMPGMFFEELGFKYIGPIDGHNMSELLTVFAKAKLMTGPVFIHVCTQKGKGYPYAEKKPHEFHGVSPFEIETGEAISSGGPSYSEIFGRKLVRLSEKDKEIVAITAAMPHGTGLDLFSKKHPDRFFDVGIAEQHAVTFAAGLAQSGLKPVVAVYSSFLQRAYDQILHDVALQNLHVVFAVDRAGIVGEDGETHQGIYDISFLRHIPNMTILAPCDYNEFAGMLEYALNVHRGPVAIRYPRGKGHERLVPGHPLEYGKGVVLREGKHLSIVASGNMVEMALKVSDSLEGEGIHAEVLNARFVKPLDENLILRSALKTGKVVVLEDNTSVGGFGSGVLEMLSRKGANVCTRLFGFPDQLVIQGSKGDLYKKYGLDLETLTLEILRICK